MRPRFPPFRRRDSCSLTTALDFRANGEPGAEIELLGRRNDNGCKVGREGMSTEPIPLTVRLLSHAVSIPAGSDCPLRRRHPTERAVCSKQTIRLKLSRERSGVWYDSLFFAPVRVRGSVRGASSLLLAMESGRVRSLLSPRSGRVISKCSPVC